MRVCIVGLMEDGDRIVADSILAMKSVRAVIREPEKHREASNSYSVMWEDGSRFTVNATQTGWKVKRATP